MLELFRFEKGQSFGWRFTRWVVFGALGLLGRVLLFVRAPYHWPGLIDSMRVGVLIFLVIMPAALVGAIIEHAILRDLGGPTEKRSATPETK